MQDEKEKKTSERSRRAKRVARAVTRVRITSPKNSHPAIPDFAMDGRRFSAAGWP